MKCNSKEPATAKHKYLFLYGGLTNIESESDKAFNAFNI